MKKILLFMIIAIVIGCVFTGCIGAGDSVTITYEEDGETYTNTIWFDKLTQEAKTWLRILECVDIFFAVLVIRWILMLFFVKKVCRKAGIRGNFFESYYEFYNLGVNGKLGFVGIILYIFTWFCVLVEPLIFLYYPAKTVFCVVVFTIETILYWNIGKHFDRNIGSRIKMILIPPIYFWQFLYNDEV